MADLSTGADSVGGERFGNCEYNDIKNHWRMSDPTNVANLSAPQPGMIVSDEDDEQLSHRWAAAWRLVLQAPDSTFIVNPSGGGHYTTIQEALTAENAGGELFLIAPGDYDIDVEANYTINFSADNQCVRGIGLTPQTDVHAADTVVCNFGAWTGCRIENVKMRMTAPTTAKDVINGSGSLRLRWCHVELNNAAVITADQPACIDTTGEVIMTFGSLVYTNDGDDTDGLTAIKAAIRIGVGADVELRRVNVDIDGSGQSLAIVPSYGTDGVVKMYRCAIDVNDDASSNTIGMAYSNIVGAVHEFMGNCVHVDNATINAVGIYLLSTEVVRSMYNHIHVTSAGGTAYSFNVAAGASLTSQLDDIIAHDGRTGAGTYVIVSSEDDGDFTISSELHMLDDAPVNFGALGSPDGSLRYDETTNDALVFGVPSDGAKRGLVFCDVADVAADMTGVLPFRALPTLTGIDADLDSYYAFTWEADDKPKFETGGNAEGIIIPVCADDETKTDNYNVLVTDFGKTLIMNAVDKTFSLPSVDATDIGTILTFVFISTGTLTIDAADADTIDDSGAGDTIYCTQNGEKYSTIKLMLASATEWVIIAAKGIWTTTD